MYSLLIHKKERNEDIKTPDYGDLVCFTEGSYKGKPLLVAFDVLVCLEDPFLTFDLSDILPTSECLPPSKRSFLEKVHILLKRKELRYMEEVERIELVFTQVDSENKKSCNSCSSCNCSTCQKSN